MMRFVPDRMFPGVLFYGTAETVSNLKLNSKTDIRFMNSYKRAEPVFWFGPCLYYTGNLFSVNAAS